MHIEFLRQDKTEDCETEEIDMLLHIIFYLPSMSPTHKLMVKIELTRSMFQVYAHKMFETR